MSYNHTEFKLGQSVPISKVYPLMADAKTIRSPITRNTISGLGSANVVRTLKPQGNKFGDMLAKHPLVKLFNRK